MDYTLSPARQCTSCLRVRNTKLHFHGKGKTCKQCLQDSYHERTAKQKEAELSQTIQQHYSLYS